MVVHDSCDDVQTVCFKGEKVAEVRVPRDGPTMTTCRDEHGRKVIKDGSLVNSSSSLHTARMRRKKFLERETMNGGDA